MLARNAIGQESGHNIATCTVEFTMTGTQQDTTEEGERT